MFTVQELDTTETKKGNQFVISTFFTLRGKTSASTKNKHTRPRLFGFVWIMLQTQGNSD